MTTVLECVKPGAKAGQVLLLVDLSASENSGSVLSQLSQLGYQPEIRHVTYQTGIHVMAILKDEQHDMVEDDYLIDEWLQLRELFTPNSVHLWRGK